MRSKSAIILWVIIVLMVVTGIGFLVASKQDVVVPAGATVKQAEEFEDFYRDKVPQKYDMWQHSAHGENGVTCINCHGEENLSDEELEYGNFNVVTPEKCGECHEHEYKGWQDTRHVEAVEYSQKNVRYKLLDGYHAMQQQGCNSCHDKVGNTCTSCHQGHTTALPKPEQMAAPHETVTNNFTNGCENCHMGPDHPQREAYQSSVHYQVAQATGQPTCVICHTDPDNRHKIIQLKGENEEEGRKKLRENCLNCHTKQYVDNAMATVDSIKKETNRIVDEARKIIQGLYADGIMEPNPGSLLDENGIPMLNAKGTSYSHVSHIENLMFELFKYAGATTIKGAQHFAPDYTHWHGNADLWNKYLAIKEEAERLRMEAKVREKLEIEKEEYPMFKYTNETGQELNDLK